MEKTVVWREDGSPYSPRFHDRFRSRTGGLEQAQAVFLVGSGLPERWRGEDRFTVLETGFGLGMNFLATWAAWESDPWRCQCLEFVSIEAHPVSPDDIVRSALTASQVQTKVLARLKSLAKELARVLLNLAPGVHEFCFAQGRIRLQLAVGDVQAMLAGLNCCANALYLDGFSPPLNPQMWSLDTLRALAARCQPGATVATYTVAKEVRDRLTQIGFVVEKCAGLAPKRHRLQGVLLPTDLPVGVGEPASQSG